ncbi:MAG: DUF222 domain-containing protein, partial [Trebonia sp.]
MFPPPRLLECRGYLPPAGEPLWVDPALVTVLPSREDALREPDRAAAAVAVLDPSPGCWGALDGLPVERCSDEGLIDAVTGLERQAQALAGAQQTVLAEIARRDPHGAAFLRDEVACALHLAPVTANQKLDIATQLRGRLFDTGELLAGGYLSYANARILAEALDGRTDGVAAAVQDRVLPRGCTQTPGEFRAAVRKAIARYDGKDEAARHADALAGRKVLHYPDADGMAEILLRLGADGAAIVMAAITAWAAKTDPADTRTSDQRRADAIVEICLAALATPGLATQHRARPTINITIAESTLAGRDDQPADMDGYGPI